MLEQPPLAALLTPAEKAQVEVASEKELAELAIRVNIRLLTRGTSHLRYAP